METLALFQDLTALVVKLSVNLEVFSNYNSLFIREKKKKLVIGWVPSARLFGSLKMLQEKHWLYSKASTSTNRVGQ